MSPQKSLLNPSVSSSPPKKARTANSSRDQMFLEQPASARGPRTVKEKAPASLASKPQTLVQVSPPASPAPWFQPNRVLGVALALGTGVLTMAAIIYGLTQWRDWTAQERGHQTMLEQAYESRSRQDYQACLTAATQISIYSRLYSEARTLQADCANAQAGIDIQRSYRLAADGDLQAAIALATNIDASADVYPDAQQAIPAWSQQLLTAAQRDYWQPTGSLETALATLAAIPETTDVYIQAQQQAEEWQADWSRNQDRWQAAQAALSQGEPAIARQEALQISAHPYWQQQQEQLLNQAQQQEQEQQYESYWQAAQQGLAQNQPEAALAAAQNLPDVPPWSDRKQAIIQQAETQARRNAFCRGFSMGLLSQCPGR